MIIRPSSGTMRFTPLDERGHPDGLPIIVEAEHIEVTPNPGTEGLDQIELSKPAVRPIPLAPGAANGHPVITEDGRVEPTGLDRLTSGLAELGETFRAVLEPVGVAFAHASARLMAAFGGADYIPPGQGTSPGGKPITSGAAALGVLGWAADTQVCKRLGKGQRRYAKARYLECRRAVIAADGRSAWNAERKRRGVAVNQFVST